MTDKVQEKSRATKLAASVLIVRDSAVGIEVLLLRRSDNKDQNSNAWVFPGGLVESEDREFSEASMAEKACKSLSLLGATAIARCIAAIRETFEETGILFAWSKIAHEHIDFSRIRQELHEGKTSFVDILEREKVEILIECLVPIAHWITPVGMPKRFDTLFFVAIAPPHQCCQVDGFEMMEHMWISPRNLGPRCGLKLLNVTRTLLSEIQEFNCTVDLLAWARKREFFTQLPRRCRDADGARTVRQDHPAWEEIGLLDSEGTGDVACECVPDRPTVFFSHLKRLWWRTDSSSVTWILQAADRYCLILDPARNESCFDKLIEHCDRTRIAAILSTSNDLRSASVFAKRLQVELPVLDPARASAMDLTKWQLATWNDDAGVTYFRWLKEEVLFWPRSQADAIEHLSAMARSGIRWIAPSSGFVTSTLDRAKLLALTL